MYLQCSKEGILPKSLLPPIIPIPVPIPIPVYIPGIAGIPDIPPGPPELDVVEVEDAIFDEEKLEELEKDPSSLFVEVAIACEAEDESCLTAVLPKIKL